MAAHLQGYTQSAIATLVAAGARPDMVQIGNSITPGLELSPGMPVGSASSWPALARLLQAGIAGVRAVDPTIEILLHVDCCADAATSIAWIQSALANGVTFDVFGESCYVVYQGNPAGWPPTMRAVASSSPTLKPSSSPNTTPIPRRDPRSPPRTTCSSGYQTARGRGSFFWEPTHSGAWGAGLFTLQGNRYTAVPARIEQFDRMRAAYAR